MNSEAEKYLAPEQKARIDIDAQPGLRGWVGQDYTSAAVGAADGGAVHEMPTPAGPANYVLFADQQAVGVIEAKKVGTTLTRVEWQTHEYQTNFSGELSAVLIQDRCPLHMSRPRSSRASRAPWFRNRCHGAYHSNTEGQRNKGQTPGAVMTRHELRSDLQATSIAGTFDASVGVESRYAGLAQR